ncbi:AraC family transcriptional regulator [Nocardia cyriacigeorgica]|uniref:AraC family transcriptional regulator n=1 Tax=Nocardia cyriacigeorgica TaxID=135487 RepID=UPI0013D44CC8|nr:AraC family transcriptional regulator [Nocardia cyriacigeorgica]NEW26619.1 AraC family transcriptional regulator [Nocardia cyriacigeorgica]
MSAFHTEDPAAAHDHVAATFAHHDLVLDERLGIDFTLETARSDSLTVGRMSYGTTARIEGPPMQKCYHVNLSVAGHSKVAQRGTCRSFEAGQAGVAFVPDAPVSIRWSAEAAHYHINLRREVFERHAARLAGHRDPQPIRFDLTFPIDTPAGRALLASTRFVYAELAREGGIATMPLACRELETTLMTQLLLTAPSQLTPALTGSAPSVGSARIRDAIAYIHAHPDADISTAELAARAGVSARALQLGFRDAVGMSPSAYVRSVRLDRVRDELSSGRISSVSDAAMRWGFFHLGRFAQQYRERFGELPSETACGTGRDGGAH